MDSGRQAGGREGQGEGPFNSIEWIRGSTTYRRRLPPNKAFNSIEWILRIDYEDGSRDVIRICPFNSIEWIPYLMDAPPLAAIILYFQFH